MFLSVSLDNFLPLCIAIVKLLPSKFANYVSRITGLRKYHVVIRDKSSLECQL